MSEYLAPEPYTTEAYSSFVRSSRLSDQTSDQPGWQERHAGLITDEWLEVITQHGNGMVLLTPHLSVDDIESVYQETTDLDDLRFKIADELGDLMWFTTNILDHSHTSINDAVRGALKSWAETESPPVLQSFTDIEKSAINYSGDLCVKPKAYLLASWQTSLEENPYLVFSRTFGRLGRALTPLAPRQGPPTAAELEAPITIPEACGQLLLTVAYISKKRLGVPFEAIARFNQAKLEHRKIHGKQNDIQFEQWWHDQKDLNSLRDPSLT